MKKLERLGYDSWFKNHVDTEKLADHEIARVVAVHKDRFVVTKGGEDVFAEITGKLMYAKESAVDLPTTGDWVYVDFLENDNYAIIHDVADRKTLIKRNKSGKTPDYQLIAANIDVVFIVQSADLDFNLNRLERYLVMINENNIKPVILLSKCDLKSAQEVNDIIKSITSVVDQEMVLPFSNKNGMNIDTIKELLLYGHTYCLLGSSGVGKTTLLNNIIGSARFETQPVRESDNKGRHTTTRRELIQLHNGAMIVDTPGMRELGNISVDTGIEETYSDIIELSLGCKYRNCRHGTEKGCALLAAINEGELSEERYRNYLKIIKESNFNEMSSYDKRRKNKNFDKKIKAAVKKKDK